MVQTIVGTSFWAGIDCGAGHQAGTIPPRRAFARTQSGGGGSDMQGGNTRCGGYRLPARVFDRGERIRTVARVAPPGAGSTALRVDVWCHDADAASTDIDITLVSMNDGWRSTRRDGSMSVLRRACGRSSVV